MSAEHTQSSPEREREERLLLRKLDIRLVPAIFVIYVMNYVNRTAITAARLKGLEHDLGLSDIQYSVVLSILFVTLAVGQPPSNMVSKPSIYIGSCVIAWGLASALSGVTTNYGGMLACRFFIGLPEASFYPGVRNDRPFAKVRSSDILLAVYLLSCWYTKQELAIRSAILFAGTDIANAFGALVAAAILSNMEDTLGIAGWRWSAIRSCMWPLVFFFCGILFMDIGLSHPFKPRNTRWIGDKESRLAQKRLAEDAGEADQDTETDSPIHGLKLAVADPLVWLFSIMLCSLAKTLGYSTSKTLLLTVPPWLLAAILCVLSAWHADKTGERFFHISIWIFAMMVGFIISLCTMSVGARYFSMFLMAMGDAGSAGSYAWKKKWSPEFHPSSEISLAALAVSTAFALVIRQRLIWMNHQLDTDDFTASSGTNEERVKKAAHLEGITYRQALRRRRGFRYLY
ncbi:major facilitator superfamily domain-containing protein [Mycena haematopus]|nr:major facilitator superfamily domain-containing protein [Mycena haematopus]